MVSTSFQALVAERDVSIRPEAIEEILLIGHVLGCGTLVNGIDRVQQGGAVEFDEDGGWRIVSDDRSDPLAIPADPDACSSNEAFVAIEREEETSIELTGGLDSRLSLAFLLNSGKLPSTAMTFGDPGDPDVKIAAELATKLGIPHHRLDVRVDSLEDIAQAGFHVMAAGGIISLGKYAGLMSGLDRASNWRRRQMSGVGGEFGINFYVAPVVDRITASGSFGPVIRHRIVQVPPTLASMAGKGIDQAVERVSAEIERILVREQDEPFDALRRFYIRERLANWAFVGLNANRQEYDLSLPLLSRRYLSWSNSLTNRQRQGRAAQEVLLRTLVEGSPHASSVLETRMASTTGALSELFRMSMKLIRKIVARVDPRRDADVGSVLQLAMTDSVYAESLQSLEELEVFGRRFTPKDLAGLSNSAGLLVGMYLTAMGLKASSRINFRPAGSQAVAGR